MTPTVEGKFQSAISSHAIVANKKALSFVEFETAADLRTAVEKLDGREFKGSRVQCLVDVSCWHPSHEPLAHSCDL